MEHGLFDGYVDPNPNTRVGTHKKITKKKKKKKAKPVTSKDVPGSGLAKGAAKAIERRRAILDAM